MFSNSRVSLRLLCVNDVYKPERLSKLEHLRRAIISECEPAKVSTKLICPGDFLGGSVFASVHQGESVVDILNALGIDYFTHGNHEYDFGASRVAELMDKSNFKWLGSNVRYNKPDRELFHTTVDYDTFEVSCNACSGNGLNGSSEKVLVGVFGVCTQYTPTLSDPGDDVVFEDIVSHAKRCVAALKSKGCEFIVALTHVELENDKLIAEIPGINIIIGGHEHTPFYFVQNDTTIIKCGQNVDHLGVLDLVFKRGERKQLIVTQSFHMLSTEDVPTDPAIDAIIQLWMDRMPKTDDETLCCVGDTAVSTLTSDLRGKETAFACMVADAIRWSYQYKDCDLGIQNGGFIRQDLVYKSGSAMTKSMVLNEMPFPRKPVLLKMRLADIKQGLEQMITNSPAPLGSFPHLSSGWKVQYDLTRPPLERIISMSYNGENLNFTADAGKNRLFLVAISDFYIEKDGDGVEAWKLGSAEADHGRLISDVVVDYLREELDILDGAQPKRFVNIRDLE